MVELRCGGFIVIQVARLNGKCFYINPDLIEFVEETPDTVLTMTTGKKVVVEDTADALIQKIVAYKQKIFLGVPQRINQRDVDILEG